MAPAIESTGSIPEAPNPATVVSDRRAEREVRVPDIGDFADVDVVEVLVAPGDRVEAEQSLIVLESDKATMEIPSPSAGVVKELAVRSATRSARAP